MVGYHDILLCFPGRFDFERIHADRLHCRDIGENLCAGDKDGLVAGSGDRDIVFRVGLYITDLGAVGQIGSGECDRLRIAGFIGVQRLYDRVGRARVGNGYGGIIYRDKAQRRRDV